MVYIEPEERDLADAWIYMSDSRDAPRAVDLLLGTQGWRRFAYVDVAAFKAAHGDAALRVLAEAASIQYFAARGGIALNDFEGQAVIDAAAMVPQDQFFMGLPAEARGRVENEDKDLANGIAGDEAME